MIDHIGDIFKLISTVTQLNNLAAKGGGNDFF